MRTTTLAASLLTLALAGLPAFAAGPNPQAPRLLLNQTDAAPATAIDSEEAGVLLWMREEEKLARDVYLTLYDRWQSRIFGNVAASEQRHFDAIGAKLRLFGLADPALTAIGQFSDQELQASYDALTASGSISYQQALVAGARIEDMDIRDLQAAIENTDNLALQRTYGNLLEGSKNHLRAFVSRLQDLGVDYTPQYIDPVLFDAIVGN